MRVVLVHDWLTGMRGGERVLERLCRLFPDAPLATLLWNRGSMSPAIESHPIMTSFVQHLPAASRGYRWYLPLFPSAIESLTIPPADVVISTSHCVAKAVRVPAGTLHVSYIHTPMRYVWELRDEYFPPGRFPWPLSRLVTGVCDRLRRWDVATAGRPDVLIANSHHVAARIQRNWGRTADVLPPPVAWSRFAASHARDDFYLVAGAFAPYKRADLAVEACRRLGRRVVVAGAGQDSGRLSRLRGTGVELLGWVDDARMAELYARARALIFPGEEDFGIVPLEAMASGCPVIAYARGGALETVGLGASRDTLAEVAAGGVARSPGGVLFGRQTVEAVADAIAFAERQPFSPEALRAHAEPFDEAAFDRGFLARLERARADREPHPASQLPTSVR